MTYLTWINQLRAQVGDTKRRVHVDFNGDGTTTTFQMPIDTYPVYDDTSTYTVRVGGTIIDVTAYTLDKTTGLITFGVAPIVGTSNVTIDSIAVHLQDANWIQITNDVVKSLGDDFWKEFVDATNFTTVANMLSLSLVSSQPNCIAIYDFQTRHSATNEWRVVEELCNWRYDRENNIIYIGTTTAFTINGDQIRIRGLKTYTLGTLTTDALDVQDKFQTILEYGCIARYYRWRYKNVVELVSKMTQESTRTPLQELIMISDRFDRLYESEKAKLKPQKPARIIPPYKQGGGRP